MSMVRTLIFGNNLEGNGSGEGIAGMGRNVIISYNRIVNYEHYIHNMNTIEFFAFGQGLTEKQLDKQIIESLIQKKVPRDKIPGILSMLHTLTHFTDKMVGRNIHAPYNWFGTNNPSKSKFIKNKGVLTYYPWLIMKIRTNPTKIWPGQKSNITVDLYSDVKGGNHLKDAPAYFSGNRVTFKTDMGDILNGDEISQSLVVKWIHGLVNVRFLADRGTGVATVSATDYQTVKTHITVLGGSDNSADSDNTIGMYNTGTPLNYLVFAILTVLAGILMPKRN